MFWPRPLMMSCVIQIGKWSILEQDFSIAGGELSESSILASSIIMAEILLLANPGLPRYRVRFTQRNRRFTQRNRHNDHAA